MSAVSLKEAILTKTVPYILGFTFVRLGVAGFQPSATASNTGVSREQPASAKEFEF
jgi:hypothetical protein